jgi:hypothetical protein
VSRLRHAAVLGVLSAAALCGCTRPPRDATPEGAVRMFLDEMESSSDDTTATRRVYDLLGAASRANLSERARRTSQLQGRSVQPWDMLAPGMFGVAFRPKAMRGAVVGDRATVDVFGEDPQTEHASVLCVREHGAWRVEAGLPEP